MVKDVQDNYRLAIQYIVRKIVMVILELMAFVKMD